MPDEGLNPREMSTLSRQLRDIARDLALISDNAKIPLKDFKEVALALKNLSGKQREDVMERIKMEGAVKAKAQEIEAILERLPGLSKKARAEIVKGLTENLAKESKAGSKDFGEFTQRLKDAGMNLKEMGKLTSDFFSLARRSALGAGLAVAKSAFDVDIMSKRASLYLGGPGGTQMKGLGMQTWQPGLGVQGQAVTAMGSLAALGLSFEESVAVIREQSFTMGQNTKDRATELIQNAHLIISLGRLGQVSESTARSFVTLASVRMGMRPEETALMYNRMIGLNREKILSDDVFVSSVVEVSQQNLRFGRNLGASAGIVKHFEREIKSGATSAGEVARLFSGLASMSVGQRAGLGVMMARAGGTMPDMMSAAGTNPMAMAAAVRRSSNDPRQLASLMNMFLGFAEQASGISRNTARSAPGSQQGLAFTGHLENILAQMFGQDIGPGLVDKLISKGGAAVSGADLKGTATSQQAAFDAMVETAKAVTSGTASLSELGKIFMGRTSANAFNVVVMKPASALNDRIENKGREAAFMAELIGNKSKQEALASVGVTPKTRTIPGGDLGQVTVEVYYSENMDEIMAKIEEAMKKKVRTGRNRGGS